METKLLKAAGPLAAGDVVEFDARVRPYVKGYVNRREYIDEREIDFKLGYPTRVSVRRSGAPKAVQTPLEDGREGEGR